MQWYELALSLDNPFDFELFKAEALNKGVVHEFTRQVYCCRVGRLIGERFIYPDVTLAELHDLAMNVTVKPPGEKSPAFAYNPIQKCCGGGRVR